MTKAEKYMTVGFNPCTILELKNRLSDGFYDIKISKGSETVTIKDELLHALIKQIDTIANII